MPICLVNWSTNCMAANSVECPVRKPNCSTVNKLLYTYNQIVDKILHIQVFWTLKVVKILADNLRTWLDHYF